MKGAFAVAAMAAGAMAHYNFPDLLVNGAQTGSGDWSQVRNWVPSYSFTPVTDVTSANIQCNNQPSLASGVQNVAAGSTLGFTANPDIYHPGAGLMYMAKVPSGQSASTWVPTGNVWFKIGELGIKTSSTNNGLTWYTDNAKNLTFTIPKSTPSGQYIVRAEHIALHAASSKNGAQFYIACGQINVTGGGSGTPGPLVAFPGAYSPTDPGILINIYYPVPTTYTFPGPAVWSG